MRVPAAALALALLGSAGALGSIYFGLPDVAATTPHWRITKWALSTTMERAVQRRAAEISVPASLDEPARIRAGASAYDAMCVSCHAAPGVDAGVVAEGLLPTPPELSGEAAEWRANELFWITKHGIRMTGMPAFGPTHTDPEIWDIVAFLKKLPTLSASEYRSWTRGAGDGRHHEHGHGDPQVRPAG